MADTEVIKELLVKLSFDRNKSEEVNFNRNLADMDHNFGAIGKVASLAELAIKGFLAKLTIDTVVRFNESLEKLYLSAKRIGDSAQHLTIFGSAFQRAGVAPQQLTATLEHFSRMLKESPGWTAQVRNLTHSFIELDAKGNVKNTTELFVKLGEALSKMPEYQARAFARNYGFTEEEFQVFRDPELFKAFKDGIEITRKKLDDLGLNYDKLAKQGRDFSISWRSTWETIGFVALKIGEPVLAKITELLGQFDKWLIEHADDINKKLEDFGKAFSDFGKAFFEFGKSVADAMKPVLDFVGNHLAIIAAIAALRISLSVLFGTLGLHSAIFTGLATLFTAIVTFFNEWKKIKDDPNYQSFIPKSWFDNLESFIKLLEKAGSYLNPFSYFGAKKENTSLSGSGLIAGVHLASFGKEEKRESGDRIIDLLEKIEEVTRLGWTALLSLLTGGGTGGIGGMLQASFGGSAGSIGGGTGGGGGGGIGGGGTNVPDSGNPGSYSGESGTVTNTTNFEKTSDGRFTKKGLFQLMKSVGATDQEANRFAAIGIRESGGDPGAKNFKGRDLSYGLFQMNMLGSMGPARRKLFDLKSNEDLFDPVVNARAALKLLHMKGGGWQHWSTNRGLSGIPNYTSRDVNTSSNVDTSSDVDTSNDGGTAIVQQYDYRTNKTTTKTVKRKWDPVNKVWYTPNIDVVDPNLPNFSYKDDKGNIKKVLPEEETPTPKPTPKPTPRSREDITASLQNLVAMMDGGTGGGGVYPSNWYGSRINNSNAILNQKTQITVNGVTDPTMLARDLGREQSNVNSKLVRNMKIIAA